LGKNAIERLAPPSPRFDELPLEVRIRASLFAWWLRGDCEMLKHPAAAFAAVPSTMKPTTPFLRLSFGAVARLPRSIAGRSPSSCITALCLATLSLLVAGPASAAERPNIVFILADDLGYNDLAAYNASTFYETPHLNRLAATGMVFTDFYVASPVCSPTRASILTGKYPARTNTTNFFSGRRAGRFEPADFETVMATDEFTLAEALQEGGYRTFFVGKWHLGGEGHLPTDQGFEVNIGGASNGAPRSYFAPYVNVENLGPAPEGEFLTDRLAEESVDLIREAAASGDPFLLYLSFYQVHTPLQAPEELVEKYRTKAAELELTDEEGRFDLELERQIWPDTDEPRKVRIRQDHPVYAAMVESLDTAVGMVLAELDELNLRDDTIVVFLSDNGGLSTSEGHPTSNLPLRAGKGWIHDGGIRSPLFVRWPGVTSAATRCDVPLVSTDLYPTLLEVAGLPLRPEQHRDGMSFLTLLRNPFAKFERGPIFFHYPHYSNQGGFPASAVRMGDYKLVQDLEDGFQELYHLPTDPAEHNNIEQLESDIAKDLSNRLDAWRREVEAQPLRPNPNTGEEPPKLW